MTGEKVKEVIFRYGRFINDRFGITVPNRNMEAAMFDDRLKHILWMCHQVLGFVDQNRLDKAFRWLGFIQGAFWVLGIYSIEEAKRDNTPEGAQFDRNKI